MPRTPAPLKSLLDDASESTLTDLDPLDEIEALEEIDIEEISADATGEVDALDILEVVSALKTSRLPAMSSAVATSRMSSSAAIEVARSMGPSTSTSIIPGSVPVPGHPSSIAPFALDVRPSRSSFPSASWSTPTASATSTQQIARMAGVPERSPRFVMIAASVLGMCLFAGIGGAVIGYASPRHHASAAAGAVTAHDAPRVAAGGGVHEEITEPPLTAPAKDPAPASAPRAAAHATKTAPAATSGIIRVPASVTGVLVDGAPHKAVGGVVNATCGRHMVKAPGQPARLVIVSCGG